MEECWNLVWYRDKEGAEPLVKAFLKDKNLRDDEKAKLVERIKLLEKEGNRLAVDLPNVLHTLKGKQYRKIYELRVTGTPSNPRIFVFFSDQREIVLLFGVRKGGKRTKEMEKHYSRAVRLRDKWLLRREQQ